MSTNTYKVVNGPDSRRKFANMLKLAGADAYINIEETAADYEPRDRVVRFPAISLDTLCDAGIFTKPNDKNEIKMRPN